ncbi:hypothetical protein Taro_021486 [Colocasia esculenta]|uniref:Uncharacterized protein n=1 Tax=Colocasia esculenta TaxID=4460 RepID=A0A843V552_COLES|nr:hypothetical protein [Colocasia esculenta]
MPQQFHLHFYGLVNGIPCESLARSREAESVQARYWVNESRRRGPLHTPPLGEKHYCHRSNNTNVPGLQKTWGID